MALFNIPQYCIWGGSWTQERSRLAQFELRLGLSDTKLDQGGVLEHVDFLNF
jgi:hypothetical protein